MSLRERRGRWRALPPVRHQSDCVCPYSIIAAFVYKYTRSCCANSEPVRLATQFGGVGLRRFDLERTVPQLPRGGGSHSVVNTPREAVRRAYHVPLTEPMGPARRRDVSRVRYFALFRTEPCAIATRVPTVHGLAFVHLVCGSITWSYIF